GPRGEPAAGGGRVAWPRPGVDGVTLDDRPDASRVIGARPDQIRGAVIVTPRRIPIQLDDALVGSFVEDRGQSWRGDRQGADLLKASGRRIDRMGNIEDEAPLESPVAGGNDDIDSTVSPQSLSLNGSHERHIGGVAVQ